jgi:hypothetical protein
MSTLPNHFITPEEYLEIERNAETKSENYRGAMFAMSGASMEHTELEVRLGGLRGQLYGIEVARLQREYACAS